MPLVFRDQPFGVLVALDHLEEGDFTGTTVTVALPATRRQRAPGLTATPVATKG